MADAESRLKCFLHYGDESRIYKAVPHGRVKFLAENVSSILDILSDGDKSEGIINTITKVYHAEYSIDPRICIFALAMVIRKARLAKKKDNEKMEEGEDGKEHEHSAEVEMEVGHDSKNCELSMAAEPSQAGSSKEADTDKKRDENAPKKLLSSEERKKMYATKEDLLVCKAYSAARKLCSTDSTGELFLMFSSFLREIAKSDGVKGFGRGWRKTVDNWYKYHSSKALTEKVTKLTNFSWTHRDILNLRRSRPDFPDDLMTVVSFLKYGIEKARIANEHAANGKLAGKSRKAFELLSAINTVRHTTHSEDVTNAIKTYGLTLEHIPPQFHSDCSIWPLLIPKMSIEQVLKLTIHMSKLKLFKDREITRLYKARLEEFSDKDTTVDPIDVFIIHKNYMDGPTLALDFQLQQQRRQQEEAAENENASPAQVSRQPPPKRYVDVEKSLIGVYEKSLGNLAQTGLRYLIAVDSLAAVANKRCSPERFVTMEEAIILVALCVMKPEKESNVKMVKFVQSESDSFEEIELNKDTETMETLKHKIGGEDGRTANVAHLLHYLNTKKEVFDVVIVLSDNLMNGAGASSALEKYRNEVHSKARLVNCCFIGTHKKEHQFSKENMFLISGFDTKVGRLIKAYSRGAF